MLNVLVFMVLLNLQVKLLLRGTQSLYLIFDAIAYLIVGAFGGNLNLDAKSIEHVFSGQDKLAKVLRF